MSCKLLAALAAAFTVTSHAADAPVIGLITKTETNPYLVKMKEGVAGQDTTFGTENCWGNK